MNKYVLRLLIIWLGLSSGNFLYQALGRFDWTSALERSYFQLWAFVVLLLQTIVEQKLLHTTTIGTK